MANDHGRFECVEPELGEQMWRRELDATDPALARQLHLHLEICDACRLEAAVERRLARGLADGSLQLPVGQKARSSRRRLGTAGSLALAAGLALVVLLPPPPRDGGRIERSAGPDAGFLRPVEGEVVLDSTPAIRWRAIPGATAYDIEIQGGGYVWQLRTAAPSAVVPADAPLPDAGDLLATVRPIPPDLAPPQGFSVSFRRGDIPSFLAHRFRRPPALGLGLVLAGLTTLLTWTALRLADRRRRARPAA